MRIHLLLSLVVIASFHLACGDSQTEAQQASNATSATTGGTGGGGSVNAASGTGGAGGATAGSATGGAGGSIDWSPVDTDWCGDGWLGLDAETCFYDPGGNTTSAALIYLHGMMPPDASPASQQALVAQAADELGMVALFPKGHPGLCSWDPSVEDWLCWPTSRANIDQHAANIVAPWDSQLSLLESITGHEFDSRYLLGFSNGGYFVSFISLEDHWPHDGAALAGAGRSYIDDNLLGSTRPPMFIAVGQEESSKVINSAQNLAAFLSQENWPHELAIDPQRGHELRPADFTRAHALWTSP